MSGLSDWTTDRDAEGIICSIFHLKSVRQDDHGHWEAQFFGGTYAPLEALVAGLMAAIHAGDVGAARRAVDMLDPVEAALPVPALDAPVDWEAFRMDQGWPAPNHMHSAADALDQLVIPKYGDILRWVADACDRALQARAAEGEVT